MKNGRNAIDSQSLCEIRTSNNNNILTPTNSHKHLGMILDSKLNFKNHLSEKISKANKGIGIIRRLYNFLPRASLVNIYRAFVRPHLDYGDITTILQMLHFPNDRISSI